MEENRQFLQSCQSGSGTVTLALDGEGMLWKNGQPYDFNGEYAGYYPACRFTALAWTSSGFLAAGVNVDDGRIVAYFSLRGGVWQPENLVAQTTEGPMVPREQVRGICQDPVSGQVFLVGGRGQVITLNGCPKCVKISFFGEQDIVSADVEGELLRLRLADGSQSEVHLHAAMQLHLSRESAEEKHRQGGIYVYVGEAEDAPADSFCCSLSGLAAFLREHAKEQIFLFVCESGVRAEAAAKAARGAGYRESYYL